MKEKLIKIESILKNAERHIKSSIILIFILQTFNTVTFAQYEKLTISLLPTLNSGVNWIDIDKDGDLDLAISGADLNAATGQGRLYLNVSGFNIANIKDIRPMAAGDQKWSDFNNDGYPDLLYSGTAAAKIAGIDTFDVSLIYHNKFSGFTPVAYASVDWGDYDNDGDYDVLIAGQDASNQNITNLYRNDKGVFTNVNAGLPGVIYGKVGFIDYDLDMVPRYFHLRERCQFEQICQALEKYRWLLSGNQRYICKFGVQSV